MHNPLFQVLSGICAIVSLVCWVVILIDAFKDSIWKGFAGLLCWLYLLYYAVFEFDHDYKWAIVLLGFFGGGIAAGLGRM